MCRPLPLETYIDDPPRPIDAGGDDDGGKCGPFVLVLVVIPAAIDVLLCRRSGVYIEDPPAPVDDRGKQRTADRQETLAVRVQMAETEMMGG